MLRCRVKHASFDQSSKSMELLGISQSNDAYEDLGRRAEQWDIPVLTRRTVIKTQNLIGRFWNQERNHIFGTFTLFQ